MTNFSCFRSLKVSFILPLWGKTREKKGKEKRCRIDIGEIVIAKDPLSDEVEEKSKRRKRK